MCPKLTKKGKDNPFASGRFWATLSLFQNGLKTRPKANVFPLKGLAFTFKWFLAVIRPSENVPKIETLCYWSILGHSQSVSKWGSELVQKQVFSL